MTRVVSHELNDVDLVKATLEQAYKQHAARLAAYAPTLTWVGPNTATVSVKVMAKTVRTDFTIDERDVRIDSKVPFVFSYLEEKALSRLCEGLERAFAEARANQAPLE